MQLPVEVTPLPPPPAAVRVFVSHNRKEKAWVRRLVAQWRALGIEVFFDEDSILPGEEVVAAIERGIQGCRHVVLILTRASMDSRWVAAEIAMAQAEDPAARSRKLIPVLVEPIAWEEIRPSLRSRAIVDLTEPASRTLNYHTLLRSLEVLRNDLPDPPELEPVTSAVPVPGADGAGGEPADGTRTTTATARMELELVIKGRKLSEFTPDQQRAILEAIRALLDTGEDVRIKNVREGSVILTLELSPEDAERLYWAVQGGALDEHGVTEARLRELVDEEEETVARDPWRAEPEPIPAIHMGAGLVVVTALSFVQKRLWFLDQLSPGEAPVRVLVGLRLHGPLDVELLRQCLDALVERHAMLRTTFGTTKGEPLQVIAPAGHAALTVEDLGHLDGAEPEAGLRREVYEPFDLTAGPLFRARLVRQGADRHHLLLHLHPIVADDASARLLCHELAALYASFRAGEPSPLPPLPVQYADHVLHERASLHGETAARLTAWWRGYLAGTPEWTPIQRDRHPAPGTEPRTERVGFYRAAAHAERLAALAREAGTSPPTVVLAALSAVLARRSGAEDVVVGLEASGRTPETEGVVGPFARPLAVRVDLSSAPSPLTLARRTHRSAETALEHQDLPLESVLEALELERSAERPPLQVLFASAPVLDSFRLGTAHAYREEPRPAASPHDFRVALEIEEWVVRGALSYRADLYDRSTAERIARDLERALEAMALDPDHPIFDVELLTEAERLQVLSTGHGSAQDFPEAPVHTLFSAVAATAPGVPAVAYGAETLTYAELERHANRLARRLRRLGVGPESRVGICLEPGAGRVIGILATLKAGGAYLPLDPAYPAERLAYLCRDAGVRVILTQAALRGAVPADDAEVLALDDPADAARIADEDDAPLPAGVSPDGLAYVTYTSGSTGRPKGVMVPHRAVVRLARNPAFAAAPQRVGRVAQLSPPAFDAFTFELWAALLNGGTVVGIDRETLAAPEALARALRAERITALFLVTPLFDRVIREAPDAFAPLRLLVFGGEAADPATARRLLEGRRPEHVLHAYGPTESTTFATWHPVESVAPDALTVPIGRPLAGTTAYVLDARMRPVPQGVPGELYLGGAGLARGYLGRPALTAERFVPHPFGEAGERLYRTGDRVRWNASLELEFLGRTDTQVKVRGFRIEPGEVEAALRAHPGVRTAVVVVREDAPGDRRLVAYVVSPRGEGADREELRRHLRQQLPEYMVPSAIVALNELPTTATGKVDRRALPAPDGRAEEYAAPATDTEKLVAQAWAEVLGVERVGVRDNFFDLGGHSLAAMRLSIRIRAATGAALPLSALFDAPTVERLAALIDRALDETLLQELDALSDAEMETLLDSESREQER